MENRIIEVARAVFIEKGYVETSMSEIAARVGINRPGLHYYFRTKDKMFQAVFGSIVLSVIPRVFEALMHKDKSIAQRVDCMVDAYYNLFVENPKLPMFMFKEVNRNPELVIQTISELNVVDLIKKATASIQEEMNEGKLKQVPLQFLFYNFYSLLVFPFITKDIVVKIFDNDEAAFRMHMADWKKNIVSQMQYLLEVQK